VTPLTETCPVAQRRRHTLTCDESAVRVRRDPLPNRRRFQSVHELNETD